MLEYELKYNAQRKRPDIGILDERGKPFLLVECKAPDVALSEDVFLQLATYFSISGSQYLMLTNGYHHVYAKVQPNSGEIVYIEALPGFK